MAPLVDGQHRVIIGGVGLGELVPDMGLPGVAVEKDQRRFPFGALVQVPQPDPVQGDVLHISQMESTAFISAPCWDSTTLRPLDDVVNYHPKCSI